MKKSQNSEFRTQNTPGINLGVSDKMPRIFTISTYLKIEASNPHRIASRTGVRMTSDSLANDSFW